MGLRERGVSDVAEGTPTDAEFEDLIGKTLDGRYRIEQILGTGGMGGVLRAVHVGLKNDVAVKVLRARFGDSGETAKRFEREAHSASRLDHPNCVRVTDFGSTEDGRRYLVMPFLDGEELQDLLGMPWEHERAVDLGLQLFRGLAHAHRQGIVHRDLKPANVFVTLDDRDQETIKLVDFGIAKLINDSVFDEKLTRAGVIFGTPRYMSPEQASGGKVDARTDLYSAGLLLYQMLVGHPPFEADDAPALLRMHMIAPPPPLPDEVPASLRELVMRLLEKMPADRPSSADEVVDALEAIRAGLAAGPGPTDAEVVAVTDAGEDTQPEAGADETTHEDAAALPGSVSRPLAGLVAGSARERAPATNVYGWSAPDTTPPPPSATVPSAVASAPAPVPPTAPSSTPRLTVRTVEPAPVPAPARKSDNTAMYIIAACVGAVLVVGMIAAVVGLMSDDEEAAGSEATPAAAGTSEPAPRKRTGADKKSRKKKNKGKKKDDGLWRLEPE